MALIFGCEVTLAAFETDRDRRFFPFVDDSEWPVLHIFLKIRFIHLASDETLGVEDGVAGLERNAFLAESPTCRSSVKLTYECVIR